MDSVRISNILVRYSANKVKGEQWPLGISIIKEVEGDIIGDVLLNN